MTHDLDAPTRIDETPESKLAVFPLLDDYEVLRELGRGGMGMVYLARQKSLDRLVALKMILSSLPDSEVALLEEARIASKLEHPAIVPIYEVNTTSRPWYFSMGYIDGSDLSRRLMQKVLTPEELLNLALTLCDALEHAHCQGILHLDIKPANILIDRQQRPKLSDFGLSSVVGATRQASAAGTPHFMSPEQALGAKTQLTPASDIYSFGAVMYAALAGRPPIVASDPQELTLRVISVQPAAVRQLAPRVSPELEAIIMHCLKKSPTERYMSATELKNDLRAFASGQPAKVRPISVISRSLFQVKRHVLAASVSGTAVLLLLLAVGWIVIRFFAISAELSQVQDENHRLQAELQIVDQSIAGFLTEQQRSAFEFSVSQELASSYNAQGNQRVAVAYAARALLLLQKEQRGDQRELIVMFGNLSEVDSSDQADDRQASMLTAPGVNGAASGLSTVSMQPEDVDLVSQFEQMTETEQDAFLRRRIEQAHQTSRLHDSTVMPKQ